MWKWDPTHLPSHPPVAKIRPSDLIRTSDAPGCLRVTEPAMISLLEGWLKSEYLIILSSALVDKAWHVSGETSMARTKWTLWYIKRVQAQKRNQIKICVPSALWPQSSPTNFLVLLHLPYLLPNSIFNHNTSRIRALALHHRLTLL